MIVAVSVKCPNCTHDLEVDVDPAYAPSSFKPEAFGTATATVTDKTSVPLPPAPAVKTAYGVSVGANVTTFNADNARFGGKLNIRSLFFQWPSALDALTMFAPCAPDKAAGRRPLINVKFNPGAAAIHGGQLDGTIKAMASAAKTYAAPLLIRWGGEMDRRSDSAADYIAAWRKIVGIFRTAAVVNVRHLWSPVMSGLLSGRAQPFWPGDGWVDVVAADGYNVAAGSSRTFQLICKPMVDFTALHGHLPMMVPETGCRSGDGDAARATWLTQMGAYCKATPTLEAVAYFDVLDPTSNTDWRLPPGTKSEVAFRAVATA